MARRLGGYLLLAGALLLGISIVLLALYGGIGHATAAGLLLAASLALIRAGGLAVSVASSQKLGNPVTRIGVGVASVGLLGMSGFSLMSGIIQTDPLENMPMGVLGGIGILAIPAGVLLTAASLAWQGLRSRARS